VTRNDRPEETSRLRPAVRSDVPVVAKGRCHTDHRAADAGGLSFLFVAIAVRILGTADYGLFRQAVQVLAIAGQIGLLGFNYSAMRFIARSRATETQVACACRLDRADTRVSGVWNGMPRPSHRFGCTGGTVCG
jgi:hypothetical protein